ncbi:MAG TPA: cell surface protein [Verrucomicrobiales bacterium]|nr:cell surface protein [Verrucomicrobiales bacterium]
MKFSCPHCTQHIEADAAWLGHTVTCPSCAREFVVQGAPAVAPAAAPPATPAATRSRGPTRVWVGVGLVILACVGAATLRVRQGGGIAATLAALKPVPISELRVFPAEVHLAGGGARQSLVAQALLGSGATRDLTTEASYTVRDRGVASVDHGVVTPRADGTTEIRVRYSGREVVVPVTVGGAKAQAEVSFRLDVMPVLMKAGCNSGGCHGASRGKEGFHLSLFGYDPDGDYDRLTREIVGRRVNLAIPEESLILEKGLGKVQHGGGERFKEGGDLHKTLLRWLQAGAPKDGPTVAHVEGLQILPRQAVLEGKDQVQRMTVLARYSDGTERDVTRLAVFFSNNDVAAKVSEEGVVTSGQRGDAFVMARFETHTVGAQVLVVPRDPGFVFPAVAEGNYIDGLVHAKLRKLRMAPSEVCDDATFIRRAYLDITGLLPTPAQVTEFTQGMSAGKREQLVDELLQRKEFADLWVMKFAELLQIRSVQDQFSYKAAVQYYDWLRDQMLANVPIDQVVRSLITGTGSVFQHPEANYYQVQTDTLKLAENTAQVFMGMRIQCAQCHNHPFDRWTMNDYYSWAGFFARIGRKPGEDPRESIVFDRPDGESKHLVGGRVMAPKFLGGAQPEIPEGKSRREVLAAWITSADNPHFARNLANIVWAHFMGRGIIDPVDDVRVSNPASNPELLEALGARFAEYRFDFRRLVRDICTSRTYQLSTRANESNALDDRNFSHATVRRLRAEVLLDVLTEVTETRNKFQGLPRGARAVEIPDGNVNNYFLRTFGRATRNTVCSCEVRTEPNLSQALHLLNGTATHEKIEQGGVVKRLLKESRKPDEIVDELYLRCLARRPTDEERGRLAPFLKEPADPAAALNDLFWALLNSKEFVFNH